MIFSEDCRAAFPTSKWGVGYITDIYEPLLQRRADSIKSVLELGVDAGDSLRLWKHVMPWATIMGVDLRACGHLGDGISLVLGDAYRDTTVTALSMMQPKGFDLIIDDGPHTLESLQYFVSKYPSLLAPMGILIVEDIIDISWTDPLAAALDSKRFEITRHCMAGRASMTEEMRERWKAGLDVIVAEPKA